MSSNRLLIEKLCPFNDDNDERKKTQISAFKVDQFNFLNIL